MMQEENEIDVANGYESPHEIASVGDISEVYPQGVVRDSPKFTRSFPWCLILSVLVLVNVFLYPLLIRNDGWWTAITVLQSVVLFIMLVDIVFSRSFEKGTIENIAQLVTRTIQIVVFGLAIVTLPPVAISILGVPRSNKWYLRIRSLMQDLSLVQLTYVPLLLTVRYRPLDAWSSRMAMTIRQPLMVAVPFVIGLLFVTAGQLRNYAAQPVPSIYLKATIDFLGLAGCQALTLDEIVQLFGYNGASSGAHLGSARFGTRSFAFPSTHGDQYTEVRLYGMFPGSPLNDPAAYGFSVVYDYSKFERQSVIFAEGRRLAAICLMVVLCLAVHYFVWRVLEVNLAELLQPLVEKARTLDPEGNLRLSRPQPSEHNLGAPRDQHRPFDDECLSLEDAVIKVTSLLNNFDSLKSNTGAMRVLNTLLDTKEVDAPTLKFLMDNYMGQDELEIPMNGRRSSARPRLSSMRTGTVAHRSSVVTAGSSVQSKKASLDFSKPNNLESVPPVPKQPRALPATFERMKLFEHITPLDLQKLDSWEWDPWYYTREQLVAAVMQLFINLDLLDAESLTDADKLWSFLDELSKMYNEVPYHNWKHAADVTHTVYLLLRATDHRTQITTMEKFALMVAACAHDVGHPGTNNPFLVSTRDPLAITYNDNSVLENRHLAILYGLAASKPSCDIFSELSPEAWRECRKLIIDCILHTDMSNHFRMVSSLQQFADMCQRQRRHIQEYGGVTKDSIFESKEERMLMLHTLLHTADISNMLKPNQMALQWGTRVLEEFFSQGDKERAIGVPISPMMDRGATSIGLTQLNFIEFIVEPLLCQVVRLFPELSYMYGHLCQNYESYYHQTINEIKTGLANITHDALDEKLRAFRVKITTNERVAQRNKRMSVEQRGAGTSLIKAVLEGDVSGESLSNRGTQILSVRGSHIAAVKDAGPQRSTASALLKEPRRGFRQSIENFRATLGSAVGVGPISPTPSATQSRSGYLRSSETNYTLPGSPSRFQKGMSIGGPIPITGQRLPAVSSNLQQVSGPMHAASAVSAKSAVAHPAKFTTLPPHAEAQLKGGTPGEFSSPQLSTIQVPPDTEDRAQEPMTKERAAAFGSAPHVGDWTTLESAANTRGGISSAVGSPTPPNAADATKLQTSSGPPI